MRSRNRSLAALGLSLCLAAALGLPSTAAADHRDGWRNERHDRDRDDRGRHGGWDRHDDRGHGHAYGWGRGGYGPRYGYVAHRHGPGCGHGGYAYAPRYGYRYSGWRPNWFWGR
jgi:hypothetical protein